ncbi:MAG: hypothetical protein KBD82_09795, partial [Rhodoferax sp.]|uniref:hypothetical protein n=1 Tax=Rhodoferax sp. TaxID=50421 RepID=UPI001B68CC20
EHFLGELRQGRFAARRGCLVIARHENSFGGLLCLAHKISDRLRGHCEAVMTGLFVCHQNAIKTPLRRHLGEPT